MFSFQPLSKSKQVRMEILKPILIVASVLIVLALTVSIGFAKIESRWFIFPFSEIRISTLTTAVACFALVLFLQRRNTLKSMYYALLSVIVPVALFEIIWYYSAAVLNGWDLRIIQFAALFGWVLLGISAVFRRRPPRISIILYGVFAISFAIWLGTGFEFNYLGSSTFSFSAEVFNVLSKTALLFAYAIHIGNV